MFISMDEHRDFTIVQGMKSPIYKRISTRQLLDEMEFTQCEIDRQYVRFMIDIMDRMYLESKNKRAN